jgi:hypothetical protein
LYSIVEKELGPEDKALMSGLEITEVGQLQEITKPRVWLARER